MISLSYACAINNGKEVVLTGGFGNRKDVSVYSMSGFVRNLPDLNIGRQYHACAMYQDQNGKNVILNCLCSEPHQTYFRYS